MEWDENNRKLLRRELYRSAFATAIIAGVFSVFVAVMLVTNWMGARRVDPLVQAEDDSTLERAKKAMLVNAISDEEKQIKDQLQQRIWRFDQQIRSEYWLRRRLSAEGGVLLFIGLLLLTGSVLVARHYSPDARPFALPPADTDPAGTQLRQAWQMRLAVAVTAILLFLVGLWWVRRHTPADDNPTRQDAASTTETSMAAETMQ